MSETGQGYRPDQKNPPKVKTGRTNGGLRAGASDDELTAAMRDRARARRDRSTGAASREPWDQKTRAFGFGEGERKIAEPTPEQQQEALYTDRFGVPGKNALAGRGYEPADKLPQFNRGEVAPRITDRWGVTPYLWDSKDWDLEQQPFTPTITGAREKGPKGIYFSDFAGKAHPDDIRFAGVLEIGKDGPLTITRVGEEIDVQVEDPYDTNGPKLNEKRTVHKVDADTGKQFEVKYSNPESFGVTAKQIKEGLKYISPQGEIIGLTDVHEGTKHPRIVKYGVDDATGREVYVFTDTSGRPIPERRAEETGLFYIPQDGKDRTPVPFVAFDSVPPTPKGKKGAPQGAMEEPRDYKYVSGKSHDQVIVGENAFFDVGQPPEIKEIGPQPKFGKEKVEPTSLIKKDAKFESFLRDTQRLVPVGWDESLLYATGMSPREFAAQHGRVAHLRSLTTYPTIFGNDAKVTEADIQLYLSGNADKIKRKQRWAIERADKRFKAAIQQTDTYPPADIHFVEAVQAENFLAQDAPDPDTGRPSYRANDIRFGIYDEQILSTLTALVDRGPQTKFFDPTTGKDVWGQDRSSPWFCIARRNGFYDPRIHDRLDASPNLDRREKTYTRVLAAIATLPTDNPTTGEPWPDLSSIDKTDNGTGDGYFKLGSKIIVDQWGQPKYLDEEQTEPNPYFMRERE